MDGYAGVRVFLVQRLLTERRAEVAVDRLVARPEQHRVGERVHHRRRP